MEANTSSYIDTEKLTAAEFSPYAHANALVLRTNNPSDPSIDLTTPLSRVLFDLQEIDSNIHSLTSRSALEILKHTSTQNAAAARIITRVEDERSRLSASYEQLEKEVIGQYTKATSAKLHAERSQQVLELGRNVQRASNLARQFEALSVDFTSTNNQPLPNSSRGVSSKEDHRSILQASYIVLAFRQLMNGKDTADLSRINNVRTIRGRVFEDGEARVLDFARRVVREFSINSLTGGVAFKEAEDTKSRFTSATHILYLLSPISQAGQFQIKKEDFIAQYLIQALQEYLSNAIKSSSAGIARALGQLPMLDRALPEVSARCQSIAALETLLRGISPPLHPSILPLSKGVSDTEQTGQEDDSDSDDSDGTAKDTIDGSSDGTESKENFLSLLLESLDTSSLPSYFWRSLASQLSSRVQEILNRGGIAARTLRANRDDVRNQIRECVLKGSKMPGGLAGGAGPGPSGKEQMVGNWEREAAVMVGSVMGPLSR